MGVMYGCMLDQGCPTRNRINPNILYYSIYTIHRIAEYTSGIFVFDNIHILTTKTLHMCPAPSADGRGIKNGQTPVGLYSLEKRVLSSNSCMRERAAG